MNPDEIDELCVRVNDKTRYRIADDAELSSIQMYYFRLSAIRTWGYHLHLHLEGEGGRFASMAQSLVDTIEPIWKEARSRYDEIYKRVYDEEWQKEIKSLGGAE